MIRPIFTTALLSLCSLGAAFTPASPDGAPLPAKPRLLDPAMAQAFPENPLKFAPRQIPLADWNIASPALDGKDPIRTHRQDGRIVLRPGTNTPENSFGWIEGPLITGVPAGSGADGEHFVFEVRFEYPEGPEGQAPALRLRVHTESFSHYIDTGVTPIAVREGERSGVRRAYFDRNLLSETSTLRVFIDLLSVDVSGNPVDAEYPIHITETSAYITEAGRPAGQEVYRAVYTEPGRNLYALTGNHVAPFLVRTDAVLFAWDESHLFVLNQNRHLYAYNANQPVSGILVDNFGDIADIAVLGNRVIYITLSGEAWEWRGASGTYFQLGSNADGVASAADDRTFLILDLNSANNLFRLFRFDVSDPSATVQPVTATHSVLDMFGRWSRHY